MITHLSEPLLLALELVVFAIAAALHGLTGLGLPMIGTIALAMLYPLPKAIALMAFPSLLLNLIVLTTNNHQSLAFEARYYAKKYGLLALTSLIGSVIGVKLLLFVPAGYVYLLMAAVTLYFVINGYLSQKGVIQALHIPTSTLSMIGFGLAAGIVGGATNAMSPILMMYLFSKTDDKHEIVKASNVCYFLSKIVQLALLKEQVLAFGRLEIITLVAICTASVIFLMVGIWLRSKVSNDKFRLAIFAILLLLAIKVGWSGVRYFIQ